MTTTTISIVIPTLNRRNFLEKCLRCIAEQDTVRLTKVIVVYNYSTDVPMAHFSQTFSNKLNFLKVDGKSSIYKRNYGASHITDDYIAFLDDDSYIDSSWIDCLLNEFDNNSTTLAQVGKIIWCGKLNSLRSQSLFSSVLPLMRQKTYDHRHKIFTSDEYSKEINNFFHLGNLGNVKHLSTHLSAGNCAMSRELFENLGGFDINYIIQYDKELAFRMLKRGHAIIYNPNMIISHDHDNSFKRLAILSVKTPKYQILLQKRYPDLTKFSLTNTETIKLTWYEHLIKGLINFINKGTLRFYEKNNY
ncbi:glycosyltransferase family 2 protein [Chitinophaga pinensis]|uniref:Glycosyl transferase family 2 n=1 Tax=Chitinophaga pinensis (strain ATCC 43595 / DSM 2588 / LMG 13176 / NBRC 15968 / NCIMB 11800 / UQM 2034) TaxID=485918 RepID=A0A979GYD8_CHIPD|nr:glycosyltransferase [Chitinophaga pinensis]ACU63081.1 glycosyl transferase family 2 [Chitinophaga pinensis DSM 2588]